MAAEQANQKLQAKGKKENWKHCEITVVIQIWRDHIDDLRRTKRNCLVYQKMSDELKHSDLRPWDVIQRKIKNLTAEYR